MTDIVERLRQGVYCPVSGVGGDLGQDMLEAADAIERLRAAMSIPEIEPGSQKWAGMDGAIAFHLIERHANNWADIGRMMHEWLAANAGAAMADHGTALPTDGATAGPC